MSSANPLGSTGTRRLGGYELRAKIAGGGMAEVYLARRLDGPAAGELLAIKTIRERFAQNTEFVEMFMDEAKIVSRLVHPNIVRYYELGADSRQIFLAMELLLGQSVWSVWDACRARGVRLRYDMIAWIGARAATGLHYAHELLDEAGRPLDIVHRDVNATNIFVTFDGEIKLIDFGLAKAANRVSKTAAGTIKGKVAYMSPEQAVGAPIDRRTDIFALGTTLWELSCDRRLFKHADEVETLRRVHAADVPDPTRLVDGFPPPLWLVLRKALARDKRDRYATALALAADLDALAQRSATNTRSVAEVMAELFGEDRARQLAWVAQARSPEPSGSLEEELKPSSTFWVHDGAGVDDGPAPASRPADVAGHGSTSAGRSSRARYVAVALALAVVFGIAAIWAVLSRP